MRVGWALHDRLYPVFNGARHKARMKSLECLAAMAGRRERRLLFRTLNPLELPTAVVCEVLDYITPIPC